MPQAIEFKNKYKCNVVVSSFHNEWFEGLDAYKDITFTKPDTPYPAYAHYKLGWFKLMISGIMEIKIRYRQTQFL
jgi:hypothetical protein